MRGRVVEPLFVIHTQEGGSQDLSLVSLGFLEVLHAFVTTLDDVSPDPFPGMSNHDALVVVAHVQGIDFGVHQLKDLVQQLHPVQALHACFGIFNHFGAVRHVSDHLVEVALSLVRVLSGVLAMKFV